MTGTALETTFEAGIAGSGAARGRFRPGRRARALPPDMRSAERLMAAAIPEAATGLESFLAGIERQAYRLARYAVRDHELALDIVQDSMLKLVEHYAAKPATEWPALFFTILRHRIHDSRRQRWLRNGTQRVVSLFGLGRGRDGEDDYDPLESGPLALEAAGRERPEDRLHAERLRAAIERALTQLPERQRQVYLLRECQELSVKETAQALGCTEGTVKQHHFRAMQALRVLLAEVWNDERIPD
jgi:RNA polymerase sigma-70 factor (ECF subfamily)